MTGEPTGELRLIACPHVFSVEKGKIDVVRPVGGSVADILRSLAWTREHESVRAYVDGVLVQQAEWEYVLPRAGQSVVVRAIPMDGGGGKDVLRIVAMIGVIALAFAMPALVGLIGVGAALFAGTTAGALILTVGTSIAGTLLVSALIPPTQPKLNALSGLTNSSNTLSLNGVSNQLTPYGPVPRVYGKHRIFPPLGALHYTEVVGDQQFIRALFCLGSGPLDISDIKIGTNALAIFQDVQIEINQGYPNDRPHTLYPNAVSEEPLSIPMLDGVTHIRTSKDGATELSVDVTLLGLWLDHKDGPQMTNAEFLVEYRKVGDTAWIAIGALPVPASLTTTLPAANSNLYYREVGSGSPDSNNYSIAYVDQGDTGVPVGPLTATNVGRQYAFNVGISLVGGVYPTAAQVMAFLQGASFLNYLSFRDDYSTFVSVLNVKLAPGNDGSGRVVPMPPTNLSGGKYLDPSFFLTDNRVTQFTHALTWKTPAPAKYEVQMRKVGLGADPNRHDTSFWTALRTILGGTSVVPVGMASIAMRIRATDQLHGTLQSVNCLAQSILPDWNGSAWVVRRTSNPAAIFRDIHQGTANARPKPDSRMDLQTIQDFSTRCTQFGFEFNAIVDFRSTVEQLGRDVLAAGRATPAYRDGKMSCTEDIPQSIPAQVLTPRNSWGFKATKIFADQPHALKVRFANADTLQQDEMFVLADGYGMTGKDTIRRDAFGVVTTLPEATKFESVEAGLGVNNTNQIFKIHRYHLAVLALRPETYHLSCDFEQLVMRPGDLVHLHQPVALFGLSSGRIKLITTDALARATTITVDEPVTMQGGQRYGVRLRMKDGTQIQREVQNVPGEQYTLTFLEPV